MPRLRTHETRLLVTMSEVATLSPHERTLADTNFFIAIGRPENSKFKRIRTIVKRNDVVLTVPERVREELSIHPNAERLSTALNEGWAEIVSAPPLSESEAITATDRTRRKIAGLTGKMTTLWRKRIRFLPVWLSNT